MILPRFFFFKQKPAYELRISDWSSDVCSSDLGAAGPTRARETGLQGCCARNARQRRPAGDDDAPPRTSCGFLLPKAAIAREIGSASCRERVCQDVLI